MLPRESRPPIILQTIPNYQISNFYSLHRQAIDAPTLLPVRQGPSPPPLPPPRLPFARPPPPRGPPIVQAFPSAPLPLPPCDSNGPFPLAPPNCLPECGPRSPLPPNCLPRCGPDTPPLPNCFPPAREPDPRPRGPIHFNLHNHPNLLDEIRELKPSHLFDEGSTRFRHHGDQYFHDSHTGSRHHGHHSHHGHGHHSHHGHGHHSHHGHGHHSHHGNRHEASTSGTRGERNPIFYDDVPVFTSNRDARDARSFGSFTGSRNQLNHDSAIQIISSSDHDPHLFPRSQGAFISSSSGSSPLVPPNNLNINGLLPAAIRPQDANSLQQPQTIIYEQNNDPKPLPPPQPVLKYHLIRQSFPAKADEDYFAEIPAYMPGPPYLQKPLPSRKAPVIARPQPLNRPQQGPSSKRNRQGKILPGKGRKKSRKNESKLSRIVKKLIG